MRDLVLPKLSGAGTINHELEHARNRDDCCKQMHGHTDDVNGRLVPFEASAITSTQRMIHNAELKAWIDDVRQLMVKYFGEETNLDSAISAIEKVEVSHPKIITDLFEID